MDGAWKVYFRIGEVQMDDVLKFLKNNFGDYKSIWYYHPNGKKAGRHIHGLLYDFNRTDETTRKYIKTFFNLTNPTHFGISNKFDKGIVMTDEYTPRYITYMTKGQYEPIFSNGYDLEYIKSLKDKWENYDKVWKVGDLTIEYNNVKEKVNKKKTQYDIYKDVLIECQENNMLDDKDFTKIGDIMDRVESHCVLNKILPHDEVIKKITEAVQWGLGGAYKQKRKQNILKRMGF